MYDDILEKFFYGNVFYSKYGVVLPSQKFCKTHIVYYHTVREIKLIFECVVLFPYFLYNIPKMGYI